MTNLPGYPQEATLGQGRYGFDTLLGGVPTAGRWSGVARETGRPDVMITYRADLQPSAQLQSWLECETPGIAPLLFLGSPDGFQHPTQSGDPGWQLAVVEQRPSGESLLDAGEMTYRDAVRFGIGLCDTILAWAQDSMILRGLRPETVYVAGSSGNRYYSGATPRSAFLLSRSGMYRAFSSDCYDPPADNTYTEISLDDEVFVVGLLIWFAAQRRHAYAVANKPNQDDNIWEDVRHPFTGPAELGRLLDAVLVADPDRRMKASEFRAELVELAHTWNVELPPFPPPGLAKG